MKINIYLTWNLSHYQYQWVTFEDKFEWMMWRSWVIYVQNFSSQHISNFLMVAAKEVNHIINSKPIKSKLIYTHNLKLLAKIAKRPKRKFLSALSSNVIYDLPSLIKNFFAEKVHSNLIKHFRKNQPYLIISNKEFHNSFFFK